MEATFFERDGVLVVSVKTDGSTTTEVKANDGHIAKFNAAYRDYLKTKCKYSDDLILKAAEACHNANRKYCQSLGDKSQSTWNKAPDWQKESAIAGVKFHIDNPDADDDASHKSWLAHKDADGWVYGEEKDEKDKTHPCMVPFEELPEEQQKKDAIFRKTVWETLEPDSDVE